MNDLDQYQKVASHSTLQVVGRDGMKRKTPG